MYDRKTWVVIAICGPLLVANLYFSNKAQQEKAAIAKQQELEQKQLETPQEQPVTQSPPALAVEAPPPPTEEELILLKNNKIAYTLTNIGGGVKFADFQNELEVGSKTNLVKMNRFGGGPIGAFASGHTGDLVNTSYTYKADESIEGKKAVYIAKLPFGLIVKKIFSLNEEEELLPDGKTKKKKPGASYLLNFTLQLENASPAAIDLHDWSLYLGEASPLYQKEWAQQTGFFWKKGSSVNYHDGTSFKGGMFSAAKSIWPTEDNQQIEYAGVTNQFFSTVLRPLEPAPTSMWAKASLVKIPNGTDPVTSVNAALRLPSISLKPGEGKTLDYRIFIGPKHNTLLRKMERNWGSDWGDVMQYGWFWFVSRPLNWLLNVYHGWFHGVSKSWAWGFAIILLTITVRICIWPFHAKSTRTMKRMSKLKPEIDKIKEKYPEDPNKQNTATMELYRKYGVNPLGGCLPAIIQIPVFFGFYKMLQYAVELRGQGFLWVADLSQPDTLHTFHLPFILPMLGTNLPINLLPILMAITNFLQMRMTPMTGDKMQQRIMSLMPFMFFFFCYNFASALALYWTTQNIFGICQTWLMNKVPEPELKPLPNSGKGGTKKSWSQRLAESQAEMVKAQKARQAAAANGDMRNVTPDSQKKRSPRTGG